MGVFYPSVCVFATVGSEVTAWVIARPSIDMPVLMPDQRGERRRVHIVRDYPQRDTARNDAGFDPSARHIAKGPAGVVDVPVGHTDVLEWAGWLVVVFGRRQGDRKPSTPTHHKRQNEKGAGHADNALMVASARRLVPIVMRSIRPFDGTVPLADPR